MQQHEQSELFTLGKLDDIDLTINEGRIEHEEQRVRMPLYYLKFFMQEAMSLKSDLNKILKEYLIIFRRDHYDVTLQQIKEYFDLANVSKLGQNFLKNFGVEEINPDNAQIEHETNGKNIVIPVIEQPVYRLYPYKFMFAFLIRNCSIEDYLRKIELFVHMFDSNNDGVLTQEELFKAFTFYSHNDEEIISKESVKVIVNEILNFSSDPKKEKITLNELTAFAQQTDIDNIEFAPENIPSNPLKQILNKPFEIQQEKIPRFSFMKNFCSKWLFLTVWITGCLVYFLVFLIQPNQNNALMTISKSISTLLKAHMLLLLLIKTKVTKTIVNSIELLRNNISHQTLHSIHVYFGIAVVVLGIVHGILHMVGTYLILNFAMDIDTLNSYLETPMRHQPTYWELAFQTKASLTGFVMTIILVLIGIYSFKSFRKYDYEAFWYIHLFWPVLIILGCFHGLDERFEKMNFWAWMMLPLIIYLVEYLTKAALVISKSYRMSNIKKFNSDLLEVEIETPANFVASEAQYLQLNIPSQSSLEWHLFYIFPSNKPNFINLYIGREGTWTKQMQELLSQTSSNTPLPKIRVFGPFGSYSDKSYYNYKELMFIANDEYFAPFIPIIARILQQVPEVKIQVIWIHTTTYRNNWLTRLISVLRKYENAKSKLSIYLYLTSSDERFDIRYYLVWRTMEYLTLTNKFINKTSPHDGINWRPPNWEMIFKRAFLNSSLTEIGVFVHGSDTIYESVLNKTRKFTGRRSFKVFRKNFEKMELIHYSQ